jgi:hypothetical protein
MEKLCNEELHTLYYGDLIKNDERLGHAHKEDENA